MTEQALKSGLAMQGKKMGMMDRKVDRMMDDLRSAKTELKNLAALVGDLLQSEEQRKQMEAEMASIREMAVKIQEDLARQHDLIMSLATAISGSLGVCFVCFL